MSKNVFLYNRGDQGIQYTGGWSAFADGYKEGYKTSVTFQSDCAHFEATGKGDGWWTGRGENWGNFVEGYDCGYARMCSVNKLDISRINSISFNGDKKFSVELHEHPTGSQGQPVFSRYGKNLTVDLSSVKGEYYLIIEYKECGTTSTDRETHEVTNTQKTSQANLYTVQAVINNDPPTIPSDLSVPNVIYSDSPTKISWGSSTDTDGNLAGYCLERQIGYNGWQRIYRGASLQYIDSVPYGSRSVQYRVNAYDSDGMASEWRSSGSVNIIDNAIPSVPDGFTISKNNAVAGDIIEMSCGVATDADNDPVYYKFEVNVNGRIWNIVSESQAQTSSYRIPVGSKTVQFRVCATDKRHDSEYLYSDIITVLDAPLSPSDSIIGRPIYFNGKGYSSIKWTVSQVAPKAPKAGDVWIRSNPGSIKIDKAIHVQTNTKQVSPMKPNTLYILVPDTTYPLPSVVKTIKFIDSKKYELTLKCPYIFVTDSQGQEIDVVRSIYTGTEWYTWGKIPEVPTQWTFLEAIDTTRTWTAPRTDEWYRVWVIGKSGDGQRTSGYNGTAATGGNSGGIAGAVLYGDKLRNIPCTINTSLTSFGNHLSATSGANGNIGSSNSPINNGVVGQGSGGDEGVGFNLNFAGFHGGGGGTGGGDKGYGKQGENNGMLGGAPGGKNDRTVEPKAASSYPAGGGGGGARLPSPYVGFPYIPDDLSNYSAGQGGIIRNGSASSGHDATKYPLLNLHSPVLFGGGGGGGAGRYINGDTPAARGGDPSKGSPGLIIIEKGVK